MPAQPGVPPHRGVSISCTVKATVGATGVCGRGSLWPHRSPHRGGGDRVATEPAVGYQDAGYLERNGTLSPWAVDASRGLDASIWTVWGGGGERQSARQRPGIETCIVT